MNLYDVVYGWHIDRSLNTQLRKAFVEEISAVHMGRPLERSLETEFLVNKSVEERQTHFERMRSYASRALARGGTIPSPHPFMNLVGTEPRAEEINTTKEQLIRNINSRYDLTQTADPAIVLEIYGKQPKDITPQDVDNAYNALQEGVFVMQLNPATSIGKDAELTELFHQGILSATVRLDFQNNSAYLESPMSKKK